MACQETNERKTKNERTTIKYTKATFPYNLESPTDRISLPAELQEVSGLSYVSENKLACVQDEKAIIYIVDWRKQIVEKEYNLGLAGDFEGVEVVKEHGFIVRSDGVIIETNLRDSGSDVQSYETPLSSKNDVEGLCYDVENHRLLLACKEKSGIYVNYPGRRAVYAFDLKEKELLEEPIYLVNKKAIKRFLSGRSLQKEYDDFKPSGIAIHPISGYVYLLSSAGHLLVVLNKKGEIAFVEPLQPGIFKQPEGICFAPNGDLLIANEGKGGEATILRFSSVSPENR